MSQPTHAELSGATIPHEVARRALGMGRDKFLSALKSGEIPSQKIGARYVVLGAPFRRMLRLHEEPIAA